MFWIGIVVGGLIIMFIPPKYEDRLRSWIITKWQKFTKKG